MELADQGLAASVGGQAMSYGGAVDAGNGAGIPLSIGGSRSMSLIEVNPAAATPTTTTCPLTPRLDQAVVVLGGP